MTLRCMKKSIFLLLALSLLPYDACKGSKAEDLLPDNAEITTLMKGSMRLMDELQYSLEAGVPRKHPNIATIAIIAKEGERLLYKLLPYFFVSGWNTNLEFKINTGVSIEQYFADYIASKISAPNNEEGYKNSLKSFLNYGVLGFEDMFTSASAFRHYLREIKVDFKDDESFARNYLHSEQVAIFFLQQNIDNILQDKDLLFSHAEGGFNLAVISSRDVCEECCKAKESINKIIRGKHKHVRINLYDKTNLPFFSLYDPFLSFTVPFHYSYK